MLTRIQVMTKLQEQANKKMSLHRILNGWGQLGSQQPMSVTVNQTDRTGLLPRVSNEDSILGLLKSNIYQNLPKSNINYPNPPILFAVDTAIYLMLAALRMEQCYKMT